MNSRGAADCELWQRIVAEPASRCGPARDLVGASSVPDETPVRSTTRPRVDVSASSPDQGGPCSLVELTAEPPVDPFASGNPQDVAALWSRFKLGARTRKEEPLESRTLRKQDVAQFRRVELRGVLHRGEDGERGRHRPEQ